MKKICLLVLWTIIFISFIISFLKSSSVEYSQDSKHVLRSSEDYILSFVETENVNLTVCSSKARKSSNFQEVQKGGLFRPSGCRSKEKVAIIVPFSNREEHLNQFLIQIHPFLQAQNLEYGIFVIEPVEDFFTFNRAKLMNVGFVESSSQHDWNCFIFHDVDLLPLDHRISYSCTESPAHLSSAIDKFNESLPYPHYFGGVCAFTKQDYLSVNGASNRYWGWGGEDDDLYHRVGYANLSVSRLPSHIGRYRMLSHNETEKHNEENNCRYNLLKFTKRDWKSDGLRRLIYRLHSINKYNLYTHIKVNLLQSRSRFDDVLARCNQF